tara:strand:+ start:184 stop:747 length:564 start_codon:yes stop_codon:yes gene_type:complete
MNNQILVLYKFKQLYHIFKELDLNLNFKIIQVESEKELISELNNLENYLILTERKEINFSNQIYIDNFPIKIFKLIEEINIQFIKQQFSNQSKINIGNYVLNLNSREMSASKSKLKLTEKEVNTIVYLSKINKSVSINELQENVWSYQSDLETHTVETHIYRLRKKVFDTFSDNEFIISKKNGYQIK